MTPVTASPEPPSAPPGGLFRSLRIYNFRVWWTGAIVSNLGGWMQRIAQDWIMLTQLTHHSATAVGWVTALQFLPQLLLFPWTGTTVDHLDRRKLLFATQGAMGLLGLGLGVLCVTGLVREWHVYVFAFLLGCASAFDAPARQIFVADMVGELDLPNAVALNSTAFNAARLVGPALSGALIAAVGAGWSFLINAASFVGVLGSLALMRTAELHARDRPPRAPGALLDGLRYVRSRPDLKAMILMLFVFGAFGLNFAIFISTMAVGAFHVGAEGFGLLTSCMAVGSIAGALLAARRERPSLMVIVCGAALFGTAYLCGAFSPSYALFGLALAVVGLASQTVTTSTTGLVQLVTEPAMRGRVMALLLTVSLGGLPFGAPLLGWVANTLGPRAAVFLGGAAGFVTAGIGLAYLVRHRGLRLRRSGLRLRLAMDAPDAAASPAGWTV